MRGSSPREDIKINKLKSFSCYLKIYIYIRKDAIMKFRLESTFNEIKPLLVGGKQKNWIWIKIVVFLDFFLTFPCLDPSATQVTKNQRDCCTEM